MSDIQNITLAFPCQEKLDRNATGEFYCHKCAHAIADFRCQSAEALQAAIRQAGTKPVCGVFKSSQLSERFAKYAAAATIAVSASATTMCTTDGIEPVNPSESSIITTGLDGMVTETVEFVTAGIVMPPPLTNTAVDVPALQKQIMHVLNQHPDGQTASAVISVDISIDASGQVTSIVPYTDSDVPDAFLQEATRAVEAVNYPFKPMMIDGEAVQSTVTVNLTLGDGK